MFKYKQYENNGIIEIVDADKNLSDLSTQCLTAAFDTENYILFDGRQVTTQELFELCKPFKKITDGTTDLEALRSHISCVVYSWQVFDEINGFYMTNAYERWLDYMCRAHYKYVWCYNAKFDFAQIDYAILSDPKWSIYDRDDTHKKGKAWQYYSLHDGMGNRYSYKLWIPYRDNTRHKHVHSLELRDFANIFKGGLAAMLEQLNVCDNAGNPIRKLDFEDYNKVDIKHLQREQIDYYRTDVCGLYYGIKSYDKTMNNISNGNIVLYGKNTNVMTAGGIAKKELLHILYPKAEPFNRIKEFQEAHNMWAELDWNLRYGKLYRGGITFLNPRFKGKLITDRLMYRYDVNSEYPFSMYNIPDLIGNPIEMPYETWKKARPEFKAGFECILCLKSVLGEVKTGYLGFWFNPFTKEYTDFIDEQREHLMFEREFEEFTKWYDLEIECEKVILFRRGINHYKKFVDKFYKMKVEAKRDKKKAIELCAKLLNNSSYGKLAERATRVKGHYEYNENLECVRFKVDGEETDTKGIMSVAVGSLITSYARVWLMSNIRLTYGDKMAEDFIYCDTDSIHGFKQLSDDLVDSFRLGAFKCEAKCNAVKYLAPKTYFDAENVTDGKVKMKDLEIHSKGIPLKAIKDCMPDDEIEIATLDRLFATGRKFNTLQALNVKGGKCLIPIEKYLVKPEDEEADIITGEQLSFIEEL